MTADQHPWTRLDSDTAADSSQMYLPGKPRSRMPWWLFVPAGIAFGIGLTVMRLIL